MARYIDAKCRICRRAGDKLMLKGDRCSTAKCGLERRNTPPGQKATTKRRSKISDRGLQLREKQKARYVYGMMEKQFKKMFEEAKRQPGVTGDNLVTLLERRLDNIVFRLGFADSRAQARQIVLHGHIRVNNRRADIPSFLVKSGDVISWREGSIKTEYYKVISETIKDKVILPWLEIDSEKMMGKVLSLPKREDVEVKFSGKDVVEYYSR
jgi:small subunit ribosomal protein S4